jgi:hypothetical protein
MSSSPDSSTTPWRCARPPWQSVLLPRRLGCQRKRARADVAPLSSSDRGVTIEVTSSSIAPVTRVWGFSIEFHTHSSDVSGDLTQSAVPVTDGGRTLKPVGWKCQARASRRGCPELRGTCTRAAKRPVDHDPAPEPVPEESRQKGVAQSLYDNCRYLLCPPSDLRPHRARRRSGRCLNPSGAPAGASGRCTRPDSGRHWLPTSRHRHVRVVAVVTVLMRSVPM